MSELPYIIDNTGEKRVLGLLPRDLMKRAAFPPFDASQPVIPRSDWKDLNRRTTFTWILDQRSHGSCVGFASAGALARARVAMGQPYAQLSGAMVYSEINGGRDQGAIISDAIASLAKGTCLESEANWDAIYPNRIPVAAYETRKRFRATAMYRIDTWDQFISSILLNFIPVFAVMAGNNFMRLSLDGVAGFDSGPGNHAVHADGIKLLNGAWVVDMVNSWNVTYGQMGRAYITQRHWESVQQDCYAVQAASEDAADSSEPPPVQE